VSQNHRRMIWLMCCLFRACLGKVTEIGSGEILSR
jgi:hypothetical protein